MSINNYLWGRSLNGEAAVCHAEECEFKSRRSRYFSNTLKFGKYNSVG